MGICKYCGGNTYVEAPPFERMSDEDKDNWQRNGGRVMEICRDCGNEQDTTKPNNKVFVSVMRSEVVGFSNSEICPICHDTMTTITKEGSCGRCGFPMMKESIKITVVFLCPVDLGKETDRKGKGDGE